MTAFHTHQKSLLAGVAVLAFGLAAVFFLSAGSTPKAPPAAPEKNGVAPPAAGEKNSPGDSPMFGGSLDRNMANLAAKGIPEKIDPDGKGVLWTSKLGNLAYGGPTVGGGHVFVGTNNAYPRNKRDQDKAGEFIDKGILMCFDEKSGKFLWQGVHDKLPSGLVNDFPEQGVCSGAAVEGDRVYYVSNRCCVVCVDANGLTNGNQGITTEKYQTPTDEDVIWEFDMMKELNVFPHNLAACSPLIVGDIVFVVTANGVDENHINIPAPEAPSFIALNKNTGKLLWKSNAPGKNIMHGQWSNPTYGEIDGVKQVIFPGGDGWLRGFVPDTGELLWEFDCNPKDAVYELGGLGTRNDFISTPVIYDGRVYIGVGQDPEHTSGIANFFCFAPKKDKKGDISKFLETRTKGADGKVKIGEKPNPNSCEVWRFGGIEDRPNASRDFKFGRTMSTACIVDDVVYISELAGFLHCLDAKTGKHFWRYDTKGAIWGSPYYADGKIFLGNDSGDLHVFRHEKKHEVFDEDGAAVNAKTLKEARVLREAVKKKVADKYLISKSEFESAIRSTPVYANGTLFIMTTKNLHAFKCGN